MMISVVIPTYNREQPLRETLADAIRQNYPNFEVLVIDQTRTHESETQVYLEELATAGKIRWFPVDWASLPGARNYAVRRAVGEIILFIDDDVQLPDGFLAAHAGNYLAKPDVGCVAGRVFDRMKLGNSGGDLTIDFLPPEAMDAGIAWYFIDLVHTVKPQQVLSARGCNMSFRSSVFAEWGLTFDERFVGSAVREESDFCLRLRSTNMKIWYDPSACLVHLAEESGGCHDVSTRSIEYQITFYHNHFLMGLKNLTPFQCLRFFAKLFDCHVLGNPPCHKSRSPIKIIIRLTFYILGLISAIITLIKSLWTDGQIYTNQDRTNL
ncbi:MAG: glycosyltransferase family 2 protein [Microcoleus sp. PH2017_10_PVI_O_A]|uniref:hormogonium polysaccharide biosynthesis glycosyltransferase HpsN n=1 Tax=unclassified Microcoleus TaxID=2642155 RepID=UPI001D8CB81D|nr:MULTISPECIES: hormogonium polysaccharide biosynthesis glycosyltransferase HpsN [unclassified Microcoleus]TAE80946.1 MAG: glycosyltransferase family 2 protein [Oscillatoriales cyanobacterium]MCC3407344.1 glycosyltransferase family 2 protein [Microcoleus sp. PH2017_10_PVI_O_A]MCC3461420.1 glycosyltransferase family 2 protein [Microcoleus sp. PH2017_11_PCY_U_A]MCC3479895.1 glycosyltransferase family 2 protein [Microcoleus sp. PH2017_12_PCY_D_A]MCC3530564.1 glycosyltransferase family 2 protein 